MTTVARAVGPSRVGELRRTLAGRAALVRPHDRLGAAGNRAGYQHAHLPACVAVAVATAVVPAVALLVSAPVRGEAEAGGRCWGGGDRTLGAFCKHRRKDCGPAEGHGSTGNFKTPFIYH